MFAKPLSSNVDTFGLDKTRIDFINAYIGYCINFTSNFSTEINIDLIGFSFGKTQNAHLRNQQGYDSNFVTATASPTSINIINLGNNYKGNFNSEINIIYKINNQWKVKLGYSKLNTSYTFTNPTYINSSGYTVSNNLFKSKAQGINFGVIYHFKENNKLNANAD